MTEDELPEGWATGAFESLTSNHDGQRIPVKSTDRKRRRGAYPYYGASGIIDTIDDFLFEGHYLLVAEDGANLLSRSTPIAFPASGRFWVNNHAHVVQPVEGIEFRFLQEFLNSRDLQDVVTGTAQPKLTQAALNGLEVPVPPSAEQRRIVEKVEALLAEVNAARACLAKVPTILKRFRQSILSAACSGRLTEDWRAANTCEEARANLDSVLSRLAAQAVGSKVSGRPDIKKRSTPTCLGSWSLAWDDESELPDGWAVVPLGGACFKVTDGTHDSPKPTEAGIPFLTAKNIRDGEIDYASCAYLPEDIHREIYSRCDPKRGDVLMVNIGAGTGMAACVSVDYEFSLKNVALLKPLSDVLDGQFLEYHQRWVRPQLLDVVSRGGAQPFVGLDLIKSVPLRLPPLPEQHEIVRRVDALFKLADAIEARVAAATARADKLTQAILAKAFRGELVPTEAELARQEGRDYEPASALLARIRAEREGAAANERSRRGERMPTQPGGKASGRRRRG